MVVINFVVAKQSLLKVIYSGESDLLCQLADTAIEQSNHAVGCGLRPSLGIDPENLAVIETNI